MFGFALGLYVFFLVGYGAFLWAALWHVRAYHIAESGADRVSTVLVALIGVLFLASLLLFFQVPWQSYSFFPTSLP